MRYNIEPIEGFGKKATNVDIKVIDYQFGDILKIYYSVNSNEEIIYEGNILYGIDVISNWNEDDNYLINLVINYLGLTRVIIIEPEQDL